MKDELLKKTSENGTIYWSFEGQCHRDNGPAIIRPDGIEEWYQYGKCHRDDGPAYIKPIGTEGKVTKVWYYQGRVHRDDGPAVYKYDGAEVWYKDGQCHRNDGPAYMQTYEGKTYHQYWLRGKRLREEDTFLLETIKVRERAKG